MKICIVTRNMKSGGAERVIVQLLQQWVEQKVECSLILLDKTEKQYIIPEGVTIHEIGVISQNAAKDKLGKYRMVRRIVQEIKPDIVLSMPEEIGIYVLLAMLGTGVPVVVSERNDPYVMPYKKVTRVLRKIMYPFAKGLIFQTKQAAAFFSERNQRKGIVLSNPLDLARVPAPYERERTKTIVGAGRLEAQKNFSLLISAFSSFYKTHPDYKLVIYGEGSLRASLEEQAKCLPKGAVLLPGVSKQLLTDMNGAALFALSSDFEGVPNVLIEAMSMGMPVVSTDCRPGGAANLIDNGKNGILVPCGDAALLADSMCWIIEHPEQAKSMGKEAVKIKDGLDARAVSQQWLEYLEKVISIHGFK